MVANPPNPVEPATSTFQINITKRYDLVVTLSTNCWKTLGKDLKEQVFGISIYLKKSRIKQTMT